MAAKRVEPFIVLLLSLFISVSAVAQGPDTLYFQSYGNNLVPRLLTSFKTQSASFVTKSDTSFSGDYFSTGSQGYFGADISYKWASLGYNFGFDKKSSASNVDLRFSTSFKPFRLNVNYTSLKYLDYYRVSGLEKTDTLFSSRQDKVRLRNIGMKVDYVFNNRKCYYSSSIAPFGRQLKSQGSFVLSSGVSYQDLDLRNLSDSARMNFRQLYTSDYVKTVKADFGVGYAYNWVATKHFVVYLADIPNIGFQHISVPGNGNTVQRSTVSFTNYVRAGVVYSWKNYFLGACAYNAVTTVRMNNCSYNNVYTNVELHFGMVLGDAKQYVERWKNRKS